MKTFKTFLESKSEYDASRYMSHGKEPSETEKLKMKTADKILGKTELSLEPERGREWVHPSYAKKK